MKALVGALSVIVQLHLLIVYSSIVNEIKYNVALITLLQVISTPLHTRGRAEFSDGYWKLVLIWCVAL